jgi:hypothetical protein
MTQPPVDLDAVRKRYAAMFDHELPVRPGETSSERDKRVREAADRAIWASACDVPILVAEILHLRKLNKEK